MRFPLGCRWWPQRSHVLFVPFVPIEHAVLKAKVHLAHEVYAMPPMFKCLDKMPSVETHFFCPNHCGAYVRCPVLWGCGFVCSRPSPKVTRGTNMGTWTRRGGGGGVIGECDCSGQFNNVTPTSVMSNLSASVKWLAARRRWNANQLIWSIHRDNKKLDRAGKGTSSRFQSILHRDLENLVYFSLLADTYTQASGRIWSRTGAIPMGGPFSAQSADLSSVWGAKTRVGLMRKMGNLSFSPRGHPLWSTPRGNTLSLAQFCDNVIVGARGPTTKSEMQQVCNTLSEVRTFPVLCDCMTVDDTVCKGTCMGMSLAAMGMATHPKGTHPPLIYAQPSGLTSDWHPKYTVTMQTPTTHAHKHISSIIVSAVLNVHPFLHTWLGCLLSLTSWSQLAILSGYTRSTVLRALH